MGCVSSKRVVEEEVEVYKPPPTSIAYFDINTIGQPWLITTATPAANAATHLPLPILEKVDSYDVAPQSWSEVSKALEDLKPSLQNPPPKPQSPPIEKKASPPPPSPAPTTKPALPKNQSFHTLEELDAQLSSKNKENTKTKPKPSNPPPQSKPSALPEGLKPVSQNAFLLRDRQEREKSNPNPAAEAIRRWRRDPLDGLPELCPPGGEESVVLYTTTLRGVRRTFEDCEAARQVVEGQCPAGVDVDERDVSLHGEYLKELRELVGEGVSVPRLFVKGRYVGGVEELVEHNENGRLRYMMRTVRRKGGGGGEGEKGRKGCEGCGGARFVPCLECNGSCKVLDEEGRGTVRCGDCNENGLVQCPLCH